MAVPKFKMSRARTRKRRGGNTHVKTMQTSICPACGAAKLPHRVCPSCGTYKGRQVIVTE